jgi:hypothetical protein
MSFRVLGLDPAPFVPLYRMSDEALLARGARRVRVGADGGVPDRIELRDVPEGGTALLLNYEHQPADTPFRARHAIYVREGAMAARVVEGRLPGVMRRRLLSLRAFDAAGIMVDADVVDGSAGAARIETMLGAPAVEYLHVHYARPGCFAARVERLAG